MVRQLLLFHRDIFYTLGLNVGAKDKSLALCICEHAVEKFEGASDIVLCELFPLRSKQRVINAKYRLKKQMAFK